MTTPKEWIAGLKEMVSFIDEHPDLAGHYGIDIFVNCQTWDGQDQSAVMAEKARSLGSFEKSSTPDSLVLTRRFGPHRLSLFMDHKLVCTPVERTVTEEVTEPDPELLAQVPLVKRTVERTVVEWECPESILAPS